MWLLTVFVLRFSFGNALHAICIHLSIVHRTEEKNVLLTLMELARIAGRFGLNDLPELVRMEREIDFLEAKRAQTSVDVALNPTGVESATTNCCDAANRPAEVAIVHVKLRKQSTDLEATSDSDQNKVSASGDIVVRYDVYILPPFIHSDIHAGIIRRRIDQW